MASSLSIPKPTHFTTRITTLRHPPHSYLHLVLLPPTSSTASTSTSISSNPPSAPTDALTFKAHLLTALTQFLGLTGAALAESIDILKIEERDVWIRVPGGEAGVVMAAVGGWRGGEGEGLRIRSRGDWLGDMVMREGEEGWWRSEA